MKTASVYSMAGVLFAAFVLLLDRQGVFIYFTYLPLYAGAVLYIGWGLRTVLGPDRARRSWLLLLPAVLLGLLSVIAPNLQNGERKRFFLAASSVHEGTPETNVREIMSNYRLTENADGSLTFSYRSSPQTEDHFLVVIDPASRTAKSTEYLVD